MQFGVLKLDLKFLPTLCPYFDFFCHLSYTKKVTENLSTCWGNKLYLKSDRKPKYMQEKKLYLNSDRKLKYMQNKLYLKSDAKPKYTQQI